MWSGRAGAARLDAPCQDFWLFQFFQRFPSTGEKDWLSVATPSQQSSGSDAELGVSTDFNEAEARAPRMGRCGGSCGACGGHASMRPRRVRLGWYLCHGQHESDSRSASMRPRRVRLGWPFSAEAHSRDLPSFNEAEARALRMGRCLGSADRVLLERFNDAEARAPRMGRQHAGR